MVLFNSLPFRIASARHIFTKVLRVVVAFWRSKGHRIAMFLDDGIGGAKHFDVAVRSNMFAREILLSLGFLLTNEKCKWEPVQQAVWLGHYIDMKEAKLYIMEERIKSLEIAIDSLIYQIERDQYGIIHVKVLASVVGQIISLQHVQGKMVRLLTRQMYKCILSRASWRAPVFVTEEAKSELMFWRMNARGINDKGKSLDGKTFYQICIFADASSGYGGFIKAYESMSISSSVTSDRIYDMSPEVDSVKPPEAGIERLSEMGFEQSPEVGIQKNKAVGNKWLPEVLKNSPPEVGNKMPTEVGSEMPLERGNEVPMEVLRGL